MYLNMFGFPLMQFSDKKAACYALGGALKARYEWTVQECEAVCCTGKNCNTQAPALTPGAITVFAPTGKEMFGYWLNKHTE